MNLTELRVGNFVSEGGKGAYRVISVSKESVFIDLPKSDKLPFGAKWKNDARNIEPVPITVEWYRRMGFTTQQFGPASLILSPNIDITHFQDTGDLWLAVGDSEVCLGSYKYVHQLQNLVFALSGEELEVKGGKP